MTPTPGMALDGRHHQQRGQGLAEYALILALIAIVIILALTFFGQQLVEVLDMVGSEVRDVADGA